MGITDAKRLQNIREAAEIGSSVDLCSARSNCRTCFSTTFCCVHAPYAARSSRFMEKLVCVCEKGCTIEMYSTDEDRALRDQAL